VPAFVRELRNHAAIGLSVRLAFEFLILNFSRTGEVLLAQWSEIDTDTATWVVPKERMKMGKEHRIPLSGRCLEILDQARAIAHDQHIFPSARPGKPLGDGVFLAALRRLGVKVTAHGYRSSGRDWMSERTHFAREVCEFALAHAIEDKVEAAYRRGDLFDKRRQLMDGWTAFVNAAPAEVIAIHATR
jgi:integrase